MERFFTDLGSGYWWISVVVVGVLIIRASGYLKTPWDGSISRFARWRGTRKCRQWTNLMDAAWQFLQSIGGDGNLQTIVVPATGGQRFYRFLRQ